MSACETIVPKVLYLYNIVNEERNVRARDIRRGKCIMKILNRLNGIREMKLSRMCVCVCGCVCSRPLHSFHICLRWKFATSEVGDFREVCESFSRTFFRAEGTHQELMFATKAPLARENFPYVRARSNETIPHSLLQFLRRGRRDIF